MFLLDEHGRIVGQHCAGQRWLNEVSVSGDGRFLAGLCTTPEGTSGDKPRLYAFSPGRTDFKSVLQGSELTQIGDKFRFRDFRPGECLFHYGDHSNHLPPVSRWAGQRWVVAGDEAVYWLSPGDAATVQQAHLGPGMTTAMAASPSGLVAVGRLVVHELESDRFVGATVVLSPRVAVQLPPQQRMASFLVSSC